MAEPGLLPADASLADKFRALSTMAAMAVSERERRGDGDGAMYARGLRDAYGTAATFAEQTTHSDC